MTASKAKSGFFIGVGCPGCGGELELDADFFVTACSHCGSVLRVLRPDTPVAYMVRSSLTDSLARFHLDRYLKKNSEPLTGSQLLIKRLYYPYWRVDASILKVRNKVEKRARYCETDSSYESITYNNRTEISVSPYAVTIGAGPKMRSVPDSLGVRCESVKVVPFSEVNMQTGFDALPVVRPWEIVKQKLNLSIATIRDIDQAEFGNNVTHLFNPVFSLIYFPYSLVESYDPSYRRFLLDGLIGRVLNCISPSDNQRENAEERAGASLKPGGLNLSFDFGSTPQREHENFVNDSPAGGVTHDPVALGIDNDDELDQPPEVTFGQLDVRFHRCTNCGFDLPAELSYVYICSNCHQLQMLDKSSFSLPQIDIVEYKEDCPAKLVPFWRLRFPEEQAAGFGTLLGGLGQPDSLVIPAIKSSNFEAIHRLARRMSAAESRMSTVPVDSTDGRFLPVQVSLSEAIAQADMILCRELVGLGRKVSEAELELQPEEVGLFYVPFHLENYFYVDSALNAVSLEKTLLE